MDVRTFLVIGSLVLLVALIMLLWAVLALRRPPKPEALPSQECPNCARPMVLRNSVPLDSWLHNDQWLEWDELSLPQQRWFCLHCETVLYNHTPTQVVAGKDWS